MLFLQSREGGGGITSLKDLKINVLSVFVKRFPFECAYQASGIP